MVKLKNKVFRSISVLGSAMAQLPQIAILGAGIFVKTQYIPRLAEISNLFILRAIWSRTEVNNDFASTFNIFLFHFLELLFKVMNWVFSGKRSFFCICLGI